MAADAACLCLSAEAGAERLRDALISAAGGLFEQPAMRSSRAIDLPMRKVDEVMRIFASSLLLTLCLTTRRPQ